MSTEVPVLDGEGEVSAFLEVRTILSHTLSNPTHMYRYLVCLTLSEFLPYCDAPGPGCICNTSCAYY